MDVIREIVSGKKKRFKDGNFNLDLTYITPRVIAMAYPASGIESTYRNHIDDVSKFLKDRHGQNFLIFNLSGRVYNEAKFDKLVKNFPWEDHHSPPIQTLFQVCQTSHSFLKSNIKNVIVVHCLAGKGRTGSVICCYLIYCGRVSTAEEALLYYKKMRFAEGGGVTQPSQIRYVKYFEIIYKRVQMTPTALRLNVISLIGVPRLNSDGSMRPYMEIYTVKNNKLIYTDKKKYNETRSYFDHGVKQLNKIDIKIESNVVLVGDILIKIYNMSKSALGMTQTKVAFRFAFNTAFLEPKVVATNGVSIVPVDEKDKKMIYESFDVSQLDPDSVRKDERYPKTFEIELALTPICGCTNEVSFEKKCKTCQLLFNEEIQDWENIYEIMKEYVKPEPTESTVLLFGEKKDNFDEILAREMPSESTILSNEPEAVDEVNEESKEIAD